MTFVEAISSLLPRADYGKRERATDGVPTKPWRL